MICTFLAQGRGKKYYTHNDGDAEIVGRNKIPTRVEGGVLEAERFCCMRPRYSSNKWPANRSVGLTVWEPAARPSWVSRLRPLSSPLPQPSRLHRPTPTQTGATDGDVWNVNLLLRRRRASPVRQACHSYPTKNSLRTPSAERVNNIVAH